MRNEVHCKVLGLLYLVLIHQTASNIVILNEEKKGNCYKMDYERSEIGQQLFKNAILFFHGYIAITMNRLPNFLPS